MTSDKVTAGDLMDECYWIYDRNADELPHTGPKEPNDSYSVADFFHISCKEEFRTREDGLDALRHAYKGPDCSGVGLEIPEN